MNKKKVGIISIHYGINFGSALQAYALYHYIREKYNYNVEIINYIPPRYRGRRLYAYNKKKNLNGLLRWVYRSLRSVYLDNLFKNFLRRHVSISPTIFTEEEAAKRYSNYDYLVTGSDQIWNSDYNEGIDRMYYLSFAKNSTRKIAYAASAGKTEFTQSEWDEQKKLLEDFDGISYREKSLLKIMVDNGIEAGKFVCDPTLLLNKDDWKIIEKKVNGCPNNYLLIYFLDIDDVKMIAIAKKIADNLGLKVVMINGNKRKSDGLVDFCFNDITPDYFLWLINNAEYVVTNSFHGVAFSINLNKQFAVFRREKYNSRLDSILDEFKLKDRYISKDNIGNALSTINYDKVNFIKDRFVGNSKEYLDGVLALIK